MSELPSAEWQNPSCGACHGDVEHDGGSFVCADCRLTFDSLDLTAERIDPDEPVCGHACDSSWHADHAITPGGGFQCGTCPLTAGHTSPHYTACLPIAVPLPA